MRRYPLVCLVRESSPKSSERMMIVFSTKIRWGMRIDSGTVMETLWQSQIGYIWNSFSPFKPQDLGIIQLTGVYCVGTPSRNLSLNSSHVLENS